MPRAVESALCLIEDEKRKGRHLELRCSFFSVCADKVNDLLVCWEKQLELSKGDYPFIENLSENVIASLTDLYTSLHASSQGKKHIEKSDSHVIVKSHRIGVLSLYEYKASVHLVSSLAFVELVRTDFMFSPNRTLKPKGISIEERKGISEQLQDLFNRIKGDRPAYGDSLLTRCLSRYTDIHHPVFPAYVTFLCNVSARKSCKTAALSALRATSRLLQAETSEEKLLERLFAIKKALQQDGFSPSEEWVGRVELELREIVRSVMSLQAQGAVLCNPNRLLSDCEFIQKKLESGKSPQKSSYLQKVESLERDAAQLERVKGKELDEAQRKIAELQEFLTETHETTLKKLQDENLYLREELVQVRELLENAQANYRDESNTKKKTQENYSELFYEHTQLKQRQAKPQELLSEISQANCTIHSQEEALKQCQSQLTKAKQTIKNLSEENSSLTEELEQLATQTQHDLSTLRRDRDAALQQIAGLRNSDSGTAFELEKKLTKLEHQMSSLKAENIRLQRQEKEFLMFRPHSTPKTPPKKPVAGCDISIEESARTAVKTRLSALNQVHSLLKAQRFRHFN